MLLVVVVFNVIIFIRISNSIYNSYKLLLKSYIYKREEEIIICEIYIIRDLGMKKNY